MLFEQMEPNERFRARREERAGDAGAVAPWPASGSLLGTTASLAAGARFVIGDRPPPASAQRRRVDSAGNGARPKPVAAQPTPRALPARSAGST